MSSPVPDSLIRQIVATYRPLRVILFGSHARGEAGPDSDLDLLVVLDDDAPEEALHWRKLNEARRGYRGAVDILACHAADVEGRRHITGPFAGTIQREGVTVYER
jgi:predicted nucleotidyltransferase